MSVERRERLFLHLLWQEAAEIELEGLRSTRNAICDLVDRSTGGEAVSTYPRLRALESEITQVERSMVERERKIDQLREAEKPGPAPDRLALLLKRQDEAGEDRAALVKARAAIQRAADDAGQVDLDDEQDRDYRRLTAEIASVDEEVSVRAEEIETLAALSATAV